MSQAAGPRDRLVRKLLGGARFGKGGTNYSTISSSGGYTQVGTGANTFTGTTTISGTANLSGGGTLTGATLSGGTISGTTTMSATTTVSGVATFTAAPVLSGSGRPTHSIWIPAVEWGPDTASSSDTVLDTKWRVVSFAPTASATDVSLYATALIPREMDVTSAGGFTHCYAVWTLGALAASGICDWRLTAYSVNSGEKAGTASTVEIAAGASLTSSSTYYVQESDLGSIGYGGLADADYLSLRLQLCGSSGYTSTGCPYLIGVRLDYYADTL